MSTFRPLKKRELLSVLACWNVQFSTNSIGLLCRSNFPRFHENVNSLEPYGSVWALLHVKSWGHFGHERSLNYHLLTFREHPVETLQAIQAESYEIKVRFSLLLWIPSFDNDIVIPAAGVPSIISSKYPSFTGESGRWQSTRTRSVIMPGNLSSVLFGVQELLTTC